MLINGTDTQIASAGHGHFRLAETAQQGTDKIGGRPDAAGQIIGRLGGMDAAAVHIHGVAVHHPDLCAQLLHNLQTQGYVGNLGEVFNPAYAVHHKGGGNDGDGGVFCAADLNFAKQGLSALYNIFSQHRTLFSRIFFWGGEPSA